MRFLIFEKPDGGKVAVDPDSIYGVETFKKPGVVGKVFDVFLLSADHEEHIPVKSSFEDAVARVEEAKDWDDDETEDEEEAEDSDTE